MNLIIWRKHAISHKFSRKISNMPIKVLIVTADNILDGAIGGKNTHIRLLQMGLSHYDIVN